MKDGFYASRQFDLLIERIEVKRYGTQYASKKCHSDGAEKFEPTLYKNKGATPDKTNDEVERQPRGGLLHSVRLLVKGGKVLTPSWLLLFDHLLQAPDKFASFHVLSCSH